MSIDTYKRNITCKHHKAAIKFIKARNGGSKDTKKNQERRRAKLLAVSSWLLAVSH